ncbi:NUDIX domain-containing protein [Spirosoma taeanense]|uniref:NUDIX domain-containing protein n=1 Tax=Spirosoma taeanense TaxID=2735870 RepID=A0A6M5YDS7_9BACT|nr:NUDIX domain-containing protein [Spirosoma taeanense]QJW92129.1 NUDIX domain-containing protein [Spirosoma taeanense]
MPQMNFCPQCASPLIKGEASGRERLICSKPCGYIYYDNPLPVVGAIVEYDNDTVVLTQNIGWPADWFGIVTGFLEKGEEPADAILREIREEIGLTDVRIVEFLGIYTFYQRNEVIFTYHVRASGTIVMDETELQAIKVVPVNQLKPWPFGTGPAVAQWLKKRGL